MNQEEVERHYMGKYNELAEKYRNSGIQEVIEDVNIAIQGSDMERVNKGYSKILEWNDYIANLEGARIALNAQFKYMHLPSAVLFSIEFDQDEKRWRFNAGMK